MHKQDNIFLHLHLSKVTLMQCAMCDGQFLNLFIGVLAFLINYFLFSHINLASTNIDNHHHNDHKRSRNVHIIHLHRLQKAAAMERMS